MPITIDISGIKGVMAEVNKTILQANVGTHKALVTFVKNVETDAKNNAPANEGKLRNSINGDVKDLTGTVTVAADYAAYLEFGTRKFAAQYVATLPADWKAYAATFKGKGGGTFDQFIQDLMKWVKQKGIGATYNTTTRRRDRVGKQTAAQTMEADAYAIALYILRNGIRAQPFLYPAVVKHTPKLIADLKEVFE